MKRSFISFAVTVLCAAIQGQQPDTLSIGECMRIAGTRSPVNRQRNISQEILENKIRNLNSKWYPSVGISAQAAYNSETIDFSDILQNMAVSIPSLPLDQYRIWAEFNQQIYDGGLVKARKDAEKAGYTIDLRQTEAELLNIRQQVSQVYFSLLLAQKNTEILEVSLKELISRKGVLQAGVTHGIILPENLLAMEAEEIGLRQKVTELRLLKDQMLHTLSVLMDTTINGHVFISDPEDPEMVESGVRPELLAFDGQEAALTANQRMASSADLPKLFAFSQVAYGRPGYNMASRDFHTFYSFGAGLKWNFLNYGETRRQKKILEVQKNLVDIRRERFNDQLDIQLQAEKTNMARYDSLLKQDEQILSIRKAIASASLAKLNNGIITSADYLEDMNAELLASLQRQNHKIMKMQAFYNYLLLQGKL